MPAHQGSLGVVVFLIGLYTAANRYPGPLFAHLLHLTDVCYTSMAMLKSQSTQFALALILGPLGLVYSSVATAVFLSLVTAVLFFTLMGPFVVLLMWPLAIVVGVVFVKLHNDQMRSSGSRLLLGPGEEGDMVSTMGSWGRGLAVLSLLAVGGYLSYWYISGANTAQSPEELAANRVENLATTELVTNESAVNEVDDGSDSIPMATVISSTATSDNEVNLNRDDTFTVITFDENEVQPIVIGTASSTPEAVVQTTGEVVIVNSQMVNLREGPGTTYSILDQVVSGDELQVIDRAGSWMNVSSPATGAAGWIYSGLVRSQ